MMAENISVQHCTKCGESKPLSDYNVRKARGQHYRQCRACMAGRKWSKKNPARHKEKGAQWIAENKDRARAVWREMARRKRKNPAYIVHARITTQVFHVLREKKNSRSAFELIGYSAKELKAHLERQFLAGMGWENIGEWHIDHIVPLSSFSITGPDDPEVKQAWALANLRPIWAADNLAKRDCRVFLV